MDQKKYFIGIGWFLLSIISSVVNDGISKFIGEEIHSIEVSFFRFLFSALSLIPFVIYYGPSSLKTARPNVHFIRGFILFFGMTAWTFGLTKTYLTSATLISFTVPVFTLILASFFLSEKVIWQRWVATITSFIGIAFALGFTDEKFAPESLILVASAASFASLDIINKKYVEEESMISMLFYSAIVTAILSLIPAISVWQTPTLYQMLLFFILGISANLILYFILKSFEILDATAVAPYRYMELLFATIIGYFLFDESFTKGTLYSAVVIIPSTLFVIYSENKKSK